MCTYFTRLWIITLIINTGMSLYEQAPHRWVCCEPFHYFFTSGPAEQARQTRQLPDQYFRRILLLFKSRKSLPFTRTILMCQSSPHNWWYLEPASLSQKPQSTKSSSVCRASLPVSVSSSYYILCIYTTELTTCNSRFRSGQTHTTPPSLLTTTRDSHPVASHVSCKLCL